MARFATIGIVILIFGIGLMLSNASTSAQNVDDGPISELPLRQEEPRVSAPIPVALVPAPPDDRKVVILTIDIISQPDGEIGEIQLREGLVIGSYAPNVFGRPGPWIVSLLDRQGEIVAEFRTLDPRILRVYDTKDRPHRTILEENTVWRLVVPLYDDSEDLQVNEVQVFDERGEQFFSTNRDRWEEF